MAQYKYVSAKQDYKIDLHERSFHHLKTTINGDHRRDICPGTIKEAAITETDQAARITAALGEVGLKKQAAGQAAAVKGAADHLNLTICCAKAAINLLK